MAASDLTAARVRELLNYDPATGVFTWRTGRPGASAGKRVGCANGRGYEMMCIDRIRCLSHRVAWLHYYGQWPLGEVDHINGIKSDNRIANLRDVDHTANMQNQARAYASSLTGLRGVIVSCNGFTSTITRAGKTFYLGYYKTPEEAHRAYVDAKRAFDVGDGSHLLYVKPPRLQKLTDEQVLQVRDLLRQGMTQEAVAAQFNVSRAYVGDIGRGKARRTVMAAGS